MSDYPWLIPILIVVVLAVLILILSFILAALACTGSKQTLDFALNWQKEHSDLGWYEESKCKEYLIEGYKGYELHAVFYPADAPSDHYMILSHGYTDNRLGNLKYMKMYLDLGYNIVIYDLRSHGLNKKAFTTYGILEAKDLAKVIEDTRNRYPDLKVLGLHGESLGAATTITVMKYKPEVDFAVSDCAFADITNVLKVGYHDAHIPGFLIGLASFGSKLRYGFAYREMTPITALSGNEVPILFVHGKADAFIVPDNARRLCEADPGYKEIYLAEGATHAESVLVNRELYFEHLKDFLEHIKLK